MGNFCFMLKYFGSYFNSPRFFPMTRALKYLFNLMAKEWFLQLDLLLYHRSDHQEQLP